MSTLTVPQLPPFSPIEPDYGLWSRHLAKATAESIAVLEVRNPAPARWLVLVAGSSGDTYRVRVRPDGEDGARFEASCSCRAGMDGRYRCKHIAAALEQLGLLPARSAAFWEEVALVLAGAPF